MSDPVTILIPAALSRHTVESLYAEHNEYQGWIYWLVLAGVSVLLASLPLIQVDVSVQAAGLVRPTRERTELRAAVPGMIAEVQAHENQWVRAGQNLLVLRTRDVDERLARNLGLQSEHGDLLSDLQTLTTGITMTSADEADTSQAREQTTGPLSYPSPPHGEPVVKTIFRTAALRQEYAGLVAQLTSQRLAESKARNELKRYAALAHRGIATQQEFENAAYEVERLKAETRLLKEQALVRWQAKLREEATALADLKSEAERLREEQAQYVVRAPADGVLLGFRGWNAGGFVTAGQVLGEVSPDGELAIEAYVSPRDIGLVQVGQAVRLQIDAYPYTEWGMLDGTVTAIGGDLVGRPDNGQGQSNGFQVVVRPRTTHLTRSSGGHGELKKGLTLSARFLVARRNLLQILYDDANDWLNPQALRSAG